MILRRPDRRGGSIARRAERVSARGCGSGIIGRTNPAASIAKKTLLLAEMYASGQGGEPISQAAARSALPHK